jgi:hypothetical protein
MKLRLLKTKLEHEIEQHFEDDAFWYVTDNTTTFDLYFEIIEHGRTYIIEGKYHYADQVYKKEEIKCYQEIQGKLMPVELIIRTVNNNPKKERLIDVLDDIAKKEAQKKEEREAEQRFFNRMRS